MPPAVPASPSQKKAKNIDPTQAKYLLNKKFPQPCRQPRQFLQHQQYLSNQASQFCSSETNYLQFKKKKKASFLRGKEIIFRLKTTVWRSSPQRGTRQPFQKEIKKSPAIMCSTVEFAREKDSKKQLLFF